VGFIGQDHVTPVAWATASVLCGAFEGELLQFVECSLSGFSFFALGVEFEISLVFGHRFFFFLHLLCDLCEGEVGLGVLGLNFDCVFGAEISTREVVVAHVKLGYSEVFVDTFIVGLEAPDLGELAVNGTALFAGLGHVGVGNVWVGCAA
jgi:hypothetical protein